MHAMSTTGAFLKSARLRAGLTQREVAQRLGYSSAVSYQLMERDIQPVPPYKLMALAKILGIDPSGLLAFYEGNPRYDVLRGQACPQWEPDCRIIEPEGNVRQIPVYSINAGWNELCEPLGLLAVPDNLGWPKDIVICVIEGDSMAPTVRSGDMVVAACDEEWRNGDACMVSQGTDACPLWTLKRVHRTKDGKIRLIADNPEYPPIELSDEELETFRACPVVAVQRRDRGLRR